MQITDILAQMGGLKSMARELGVSESQAATGAAVLIPAMLVAGYMAKQRDGGQAAPQSERLGGSLGGLLGGLLGGGGGSANKSGGGLASMLDMNGDGNPLDDIMRMAGKALR